MTEEQKLALVEDKKQQLTQLAEYQQKIKGRTPPPVGSEGHTISEEEMLRQLYRDSFFRPRVDQLTPLQSFIQRTEEQTPLLDMNDETQIHHLLTGLFCYVEHIADYLDSDISSPDINYIACDERFLSECAYLLEHAPNHATQIYTIRAEFFVLHNDEEHAAADYQSILVISPQDTVALEALNHLHERLSLLYPRNSSASA